MVEFGVKYPKVKEQLTITKEKRNMITIGPSVGFGYGITTKKPDIYIGVSITIPISHTKGLPH